MRTLVRVAPGRPVPTVRLWSRAGNDKTAQFPAIVKALQRYRAAAARAAAARRRDRRARRARRAGRLPAPAEPDQPQAHRPGRRRAVGVHCVRPAARRPARPARPAADRAARGARTRLRRSRHLPLLRLTPQVGQDGRDLYREAMARGWEGLIAKRASSRYFSGKRSTDWAKLKLQHAQEFVIGGWTEPRGNRAPISARCCSACTTTMAGSSMSGTSARGSPKSSWHG